MPPDDDIENNPLVKELRKQIAFLQAEKKSELKELNDRLEKLRAEKERELKIMNDKILVLEKHLSAYSTRIKLEDELRFGLCKDMKLPR